MPEGKSEIPLEIAMHAERLYDEGGYESVPTIIAKAIMAERERCAQIADDEADKLNLRDGPDKRRDPLNKQIVAMKVVCRDIAASIRGALNHD